MRGRVAFVAVLAACYSPSAQPGAPCGPGGACPAGQACVAGICGGNVPLDDAPLGDDAPVDTGQIDAPDAPPYVPWTTPVELTTLATTGTGETDPSVTANKLTVVLSADTALNDGDLWTATRSAVGNSFTNLALLAPLNAAGFNEQSPEISGDGLSIFFTSNRTGTYQVYYSTFSTTWAAPTLRTDLSTGSPSDLAISPDGLTAAVLRDGNPQRIYIHTRATTADMFGTGVLHTGLNVTTDIAAPTITNDADVIYLHASSPRDLYRATRQMNGTFTPPQPVAELNTVGGRDAAPFVLQADDYLIFERGAKFFETTR